MDMHMHNIVLVGQEVYEAGVPQSLFQFCRWQQSHWQYLGTAHLWLMWREVTLRWHSVFLLTHTQTHPHISIFVGNDVVHYPAPYPDLKLKSNLNFKTMFQPQTVPWNCGKMAPLRKHVLTLQALWSSACSKYKHTQTHTHTTSHFHVNTDIVVR